MKFIYRTYILLFATSLLMVGCGNSNKPNQNESSEVSLEPDEEEEGEEDVVHLSEEKFMALDIKIDTIPMRNMSNYIEVNGQLQVPPQFQASVTAIVGANVVSIQVIEGEKVSKGQALAYLSHPNLIQLQTNYVDNWSQLQYKEEEDKRQKKLYDEKVGSGKEYQRVHADYLTTKAMTKGLEAQLSMLGLNSKRIRDGFIYEKVPVLSPINGYVQLVSVKVGQFVLPENEMFQVVNIDKVHADFMVFEKGIQLVKVGQEVLFTSESLPGKELIAKIHSVGKSFEQDPKAIHIHAEIETTEDGLFIPGMYVRGRVIVGNKMLLALPESAIVSDGENEFIFSVSKEVEYGETKWVCEPIEVFKGKEDNGWVEIKLLNKLEKETVIAWNNAYYLMSEMKKSELGDDD